MILDLSDGKILLGIARDAITSSFSDKELKIDEEIKKRFSGKRGVFVTLTKDGELRGCIGYPIAVMPLYEGIVEAAKSAAFSDTRFDPLEKTELKDIKIEVSVLTKPQKIDIEKSDEYPEKIKIGEDGLIIESDMGSGLLLPQVAVEWKWDAIEFLEHLCMKAGLPKDYWKTGNADIYKFQAKIFSEE